jgi:hypothetical protein
LREKLARAGHQALRDRWSERVVMSQYLGIIERIARQRGLAQVVERLGHKASTH